MKPPRLVEIRCTSLCACPETVLRAWGVFQRTTKTSRLHTATQKEARLDFYSDISQPHRAQYDVRPDLEGDFDDVGIGAQSPKIRATISQRILSKTSEHCPEDPITTSVPSGLKISTLRTMLDCLGMHPWMRPRRLRGCIQPKSHRTRQLRLYSY